MGRKTLSAIVCFSILSILQACSVNLTPKVKDNLDIQYLHGQTSTKKLDLASGGLCPGIRKLNVITDEKKVEAETVYGTIWIYPQEFAGLIVQYTKTCLEESGVTVDDKSNDVIIVALQEMFLIPGAWTVSAKVRLKFTIPAINYSHVYEGAEGSGIAWNAFAYAIHLAVFEFLKDPVFQQYLQCRNK